jgi:hypothetical protein
MVIAVLTKQVRSVFQRSYVHLIRDTHYLPAHGVAGQQLGHDEGNLSRQIRLQVDQIGFKKVGPDQIYTKKIGAGAALPQELAVKRQLIESTFRRWNIPDMNTSFTGEALR